MKLVKKIGIAVLVSMYFFQMPASLGAVKHPKKVKRAMHRKNDSKNLAVGALIGTDVGANLKYWLVGKKHPLTINAATGYDFSGGWMILSDLHYQFNNLKEVNFFSPGDLHAHVGGGAKVGFFNSLFLLRIPVGIDLQYQQNPYEFFVDMAPGIRLSPSVGGNFDVHVGLRMYIK